MRTFIFATLFLACCSVNAESAHRCASDALIHARQLLSLHSGADDRIEIEKSVQVLAPISNPANKKQKFDVLEVFGFIYKGKYRMHFIYAQLPGECVLMGQEILEYASL